MASGSTGPAPKDGSFLESLRAFFAGLLHPGSGRREAEKEPGSLLEKILLRALRANASLLSGEEERIELKRLGREGLAGFIESFERGYVLSCHEVSDELPRCLYCISRPAMAALASRYAAARPRAKQGNEPAALAEAAVMRILDGNLSRLFSLRAGKDAEGAPEYLFPEVMRVPKLSAGEAKDELYWQADSLSLAWRISVGKIAFHLLAPTGFDARVERWAAESGAFMEGVRRSVLAPAEDDEWTSGQASNQEDMEIRILKPAEFALGSLFLPPSLSVGSALFRAKFKSLRAFTARLSPFPADGSLWILVMLELEGLRSPYLYRIAGCTAEDFRRAVQDPKLFLDALLRANLRYFRGKKPELKIACGCRICAPPSIPQGAHLAVLSAEMRGPRGLLRWETVLSTATLNRLSETFFDPWELSLYRATSHNLLMALLSLSRELFRRGMRFNFLPPGGCLDSGGGIVPISNLPFHEFVDLIDDHDLKIIVQNHLIPAIGLGGVLGLLHVSRQSPAQDGTIRLAAGRLEFDEAKFLRSLNDSGRELWRTLSERSDFTSCDERAFDGRNTRVMNGICEAMLSDKLALSFRARCVLEQQFLGPMKEQQAEELRLLQERRVPTASLERLDPSHRKALVARTPRKLLALWFLSHQDRVAPFLGALMSATGIGELCEDVAMLERRRSSREFNLGEAIEAKMTAEESLVDDLLAEALKKLGPSGAAKAIREIPLELLAAALATGRSWRSPLDGAIRAALGEEGQYSLRWAIHEIAASYPGVAERMAAVDAKYRALNGLERG